MKKTILPLLLSLLLATACSKSNIIHEENRVFNTNTWNRFTPEKFEVKVDNVEDYYNIDFTVSVDTMLYRYDHFPVMVIMQSPSGEERQFYHTIQLKENGRWRGEIADGYRQVKGRARSYFSFNHTGTHILNISHQTPQFDLEGIHAFGIQVERTKLHYDFD